MKPESASSPNLSPRSSFEAMAPDFDPRPGARAKTLSGASASDAPHRASHTDLKGRLRGAQKRQIADGKLRLIRDESGRDLLVHPKPIGAGSFGRAYAALEVATKRRLVLKKLRLDSPKPATPAGGARIDRSPLPTVLEEWSLMHAGRSPIAPDRMLLTRSKSGRKAWLEMKPLDGDLATALDRAPRLNKPAVRLALAAEVASHALKRLEVMHAHQPPILHRDLKLQNIFFDADGMFVGDWGISILATSARATSIAGTLEYMAPENHEPEPKTTAADIYSLGSTLLAVFAGDWHPWAAALDCPGATLLEVIDEKLGVDANFAAWSEHPDRPIGKLPPAERPIAKGFALVPEPWRGLILAMMRVNPAERPGATQLRATLETPAFAVSTEDRRAVRSHLRAAAGSASEAHFAALEAHDAALEEGLKA